MRRQGRSLLAQFLKAPLYQTYYANGFATLFTAAYDPKRRTMRLVGPRKEMFQSLGGFEERSTTILYEGVAPPATPSLADAIPSLSTLVSRARKWGGLCVSGSRDVLFADALTGTIMEFQRCQPISRAANLPKSH